MTNNVFVRPCFEVIAVTAGSSSVRRKRVFETFLVTLAGGARRGGPTDQQGVADVQDERGHLVFFIEWCRLDARSVASPLHFSVVLFELQPEGVLQEDHEGDLEMDHEPSYWQP